MYVLRCIINQYEYITPKIIAVNLIKTVIFQVLDKYREWYTLNLFFLVVFLKSSTLFKFSSLVLHLPLQSNISGLCI